MNPSIDIEFLNEMPADIEPLDFLNNENEDSTMGTTAAGVIHPLPEKDKVGPHTLKLMHLIDEEVKEDRVNDAAAIFIAGEFRSFKDHFHLSGETPEAVAKQMIERGLYRSKTQ